MIQNQNGLYYPPGKNPLSFFYNNDEGDCFRRDMTKGQYIRANFSTAMDLAVYTPVWGLVNGAFQFVYGIFETLAGVATMLTNSKLGSERCSEGLRNMLRGGLQAVPFIGRQILNSYDFSDDMGNRSDYGAKILQFGREVRCLEKAHRV